MSNKPQLDRDALGRLVFIELQAFAIAAFILCGHFQLPPLVWA